MSDTRPASFGQFQWFRSHDRPSWYGRCVARNGFIGEVGVLDVVARLDGPIRRSIQDSHMRVCQSLSCFDLREMD